jgi:hypothetical protein
MLGLGMRESSGKHCEGRDRSAHNTSAETAEAGLFQTSFNARRASLLLPKLFNEFASQPTPSYLDVFKEGARCKDSNLENFGDGDGREFQKLSKDCPFFAVEFAAIGLRNIRKHWGPINRRDAEVKADADAMFKEVQKLVDQDKRVRSADRRSGRIADRGTRRLGGRGQCVGSDRRQRRGVGG